MSKIKFIAALSLVFLAVFYFFQAAEKEVSMYWYATRSSALLAYALLYLSIFLGISIRIPWLNRLVGPVYSYSVHCWISLQALVFVMAHSVFILADNFMNFKLVNIIIPFYPIAENQMTGISLEFLALGILSFYLMLVLVVTSYLKKVIGHTLWRGLHFLNIGLFAIVFIHGLYMGTDLKGGPMRYIFIAANAFLVFLFLINIFIRIWKALSGKETNSTANEINYQSNENLRQSSSPVVKERDPKIFRGRI